MLYTRVHFRNDAWEFHVTKQFEDRDGGQNLAVRVERANDPQAFSEWRLPDIFCIKSFGFSEQEILRIEDYLRDNESIIWDDYREVIQNHA